MIVTQNSTDLHVTLNVTVSDLEHMNFTEIVGSLQGNSRSFLTNLTVFIRVLVLSCDSVLDECQFRSKETQTVFFSLRRIQQNITAQRSDRNLDLTTHLHLRLRSYRIYVKFTIESWGLGTVSGGFCRRKKGYKAPFLLYKTPP